MTQPNALRLADAMEGDDMEYPDDLVVAAELRRLHALASLSYDERCAKLHAENEELSRALALQGKVMRQLAEALELAEAGLADIGDADREPGDDLEWCERRAAQPLPVIRAALAAAKEQA